MNYYNPYNWQQTQPNFQRIQNLSSYNTTEVQCFYVNNPTDMEKIQPVLNVLYIGLNLDKKEIYLRQMNNNGLIDFTTFTQLSGEQQKSDITKILDRLDVLESNLKGNDNVQYANGTAVNEYVGERNVTESSVNATVSADDGRKNLRTTKRNNY